MKYIFILFIFTVFSYSLKAYSETETRPKKALIFGVTGQDGYYLTHFLLKKGYEVHGVRRLTSDTRSRKLKTLLRDISTPENFFLHYGDVTDNTSIFELIFSIMPDEIYNLAALSNVQISYELAEYTANTDALGTLRILEAIRATNKPIKFYQASSSEIFGKVTECPQNELTPFYPRSPYGIAKLYAYWITKNYRETYGIYACNGILYNHESPMRDESFVTRKITKAVAEIAQGRKEPLLIGNLNAKRDWGYAQEYVEAMWLMLQQETAQDFVIGTGTAHSVREFIECAFACVNIPLKWTGTGLDEKAINSITGEVVVGVDHKYFRPNDIDLLVANPSQAYQVLGWKAKTDFYDLVSTMVEYDMFFLHSGLDDTLNDK